MTILSPEKRKELRGVNKMANRQTKKLTKKGTNIAKSIAPELFAPEGLGRLNADDYTSYIKDSISGFQGNLDKFNLSNDEAIARRQAGLDGLMADENTALRERAFAGIDRSQGRALNDLTRQQASGGVGGGVGFAQRRALERDFGEQKGTIEQGILLENIAEKNRRLAEYEGALQNRFGVNQTGIGQIDALRDRGSQIGLGVDQYNQGQLAKEIGARTSAVGAGVGMIKDNRDDIMQELTMDKLLAFARESDANKLKDIKGLLG